MSDWKNFFNKSHIRYIDDSDPTQLSSAMESFASDDALAISVGSGQSAPAMRLWVHDKTIVLGIPDAKLPYVDDAVKLLHTLGYNTVVRNSGGLAVVLDTGVLNLSFILPDVKKVAIRTGYEAMVHYVQELFRDLTDRIEAFEIVGSYCPGDYDLSIDGKKFAGISQRRVKNGIAVQIYLCVEGDGAWRAKVIQAFYEQGLRGEAGVFNYPTIEPNTMQSLSQLVGVKLSVNDVKKRILDSLTDYPIDTARLHGQELVDFEKRKIQMIERNKKALGLMTPKG
ncbi:lipoate--protein ligase family protein [Aquibacillus salsiterrae]|uniref:Octanoyl-[GcvH]:protein N-octanoyltransferase n=1 Tax=Aquibacillus salsiterrae TaxID=2950439 RepID=A0A9X3WDN4_9BACI|nr:lipoate--protein ligase family protein [Aquibacillus salsiterrae]MDC3416808.1 lipoate--protein ligase family protein [Aquibacillus salsiterrae]